MDASPGMLAAARRNVPAARFARADLAALPLGDGTVDLVVCALALTHQPALGPAFAEFARVLRPGGELVVSDVHVASLYLGGVAGVAGPDGRHRDLPATRLLASDCLRWRRRGARRRRPPPTATRRPRSPGGSRGTGADRGRGRAAR